jgi:F-type H+-transporting ATPase subunit gamma
MANLKDIRSRIGSVKNTQQITRAMKMVSAAKLRRAQQNIVNLRPYAREILKVISDISITQRVSHPLLEPVANPQKVLLVVITSDRGLCGGFNGSINRFAMNYYKENKSKHEQMDVLCVGRKASDFFRKRGVPPKETILNLAREISYQLASDVAKRLMANFIDGKYDAIYMIYNEFKSAISQTVVCERLLPIDVSTSNITDKTLTSPDLIFEPAPEEIIDDLLEKHFAIQVYRCLSESVAAEHGARMAAMESATKNAGEMISSLTLTYNKMRQAAITTELIEITSGAEALNG